MTGKSDEIVRSAAQLLEMLRTKGLKIAFAESMSGGLLSGSLTRIPGASSVLLGSVVCYDKGSKMRLLGVGQELLIEKGAESEEVTRAMAEGIHRLFPDAGIFLAISGSASAPVNDYQISSPPGSVFICMGTAGGKRLSRQWKLIGNRDEVLNQSILLALESLQEFIRNDANPVNNH